MTPFSARLVPLLLAAAFIRIVAAASANGAGVGRVSRHGLSPIEPLRPGSESESSRSSLTRSEATSVVTVTSPQALLAEGELDETAEENGVHRLIRHEAAAGMGKAVTAKAPLAVAPLPAAAAPAKAAAVAPAAPAAAARATAAAAPTARPFGWFGQVAEEGPLGPKGLAGEPGKRGTSGSQGHKGEKGPSGPAGPDGAVGHQGARGSKGNDGPEAHLPKVSGGSGVADMGMLIGAAGSSIVVTLIMIFAGISIKKEVEKQQAKSAQMQDDGNWEGGQQDQPPGFPGVQPGFR